MVESNYPKYRWYVLVSLVISILAQGMLLIAPSPLIGEVAKTLKVDPGIATAASMLPFNLMVAIGGIVGGFLMDRIGLGKTFIICMVITCVTAFLTPALGGTVGGIVILRALQGLGCGPIIGSGPKLAAEWFPKSQRTLFQGITGASLSLGITIGLMAGPNIAKGVNWQLPIAVFGGVMTVALIMFVIYNLGPKPPVFAEEEGYAHSKPNTAQVFKLPVFWFTVIACFALSWVMQGYNDLTPGHLAIPEPVGLNLGPQMAGAIMGLYTLAFMLGSLFCGLFVKIFGGFRNAIIITFILTAVFCISVLVPFVAHTIPVLVISLLLAGFFMGMPIAISMGFIAIHYPENIAGAVGGTTMGLALFGGTIAVAAGSYALHATGMYTVSIIIVVAVAIIGALAAIGIKPPKLFAG